MKRIYRDIAKHLAFSIFKRYGGDMQVFYHLVYEYQKGLRDLCLFTCSKENLPKIEKSLAFQKIDYSVLNVGEDKINVFFGMLDCLKIIEHFSSEDLNKLSTEEDFILGMMLGYAKPQQYQRFLKFKQACA